MVGQGDMSRAAELFARASEIRPEDYNAPSLYAQALGSLGREEESQNTFRRTLGVIKKHLELNPDDARAVEHAALCFSSLGEREEAIRWAGKATVIDPDNPSIAYNVACVYARLGESERAMDSLEQAITSGWGQKEWIENDSDLDSLRDLPRFQQLVDSLHDLER
jgi:adenylate cyclase